MWWSSNIMWQVTCEEVPRCYQDKHKVMTWIVTQYHDMHSPPPLLPALHWHVMWCHMTCTPPSFKFLSMQTHTGTHDIMTYHLLFKWHTIPSLKLHNTWCHVTCHAPPSSPCQPYSVPLPHFCHPPSTIGPCHHKMAWSAQREEHCGHQTDMLPLQAQHQVKITWQKVQKNVRWSPVIRDLKC